jgi:hypothetical protein
MFFLIAIPLDDVNRLRSYMWMLEIIKRSSVSNPPFQICCGTAKYVLPAMEPNPQYLSELLRGDNDHSKKFKEIQWQFLVLP